MALQELDSSLVTVGKPVEGGAVWTSFKEGAAVPTDAVTKMSTLTDWESLGEMSDNGFIESTDMSSQKLKGWHKKTLITLVDEETSTYKIEFLEIARDSVAKLRYGAANVTASNGVVTKTENKGVSDAIVPLVFDELETSGHLLRTVAPRCQITAIDEVGHKQGEFVKWGMTFTVLDPSDGSAKITTYRAKPAASASK